MFQNLFPTFEKSPKVEFKSFSVAHGLIRLPPSRDFFAKNLIYGLKKLLISIFKEKIPKISTFWVFDPCIFSTDCVQIG